MNLGRLLARRAGLTQRVQHTRRPVQHAARAAQERGGGAKDTLPPTLSEREREPPSLALSERPREARVRVAPALLTQPRLSARHFDQRLQLDHFRRRGATAFQISWSTSRQPSM